MSLSFWKTPVSAEICQYMVIFVIFQDFGITSLTRNLMRNWPPMTVKCIWSHVKLSGSCHEDFLGLWRTPKWPRLQNYWDGNKWCHFNNFTIWAIMEFLKVLKVPRTRLWQFYMTSNAFDCHWGQFCIKLRVKDVVPKSWKITKITKNWHILAETGVFKKLGDIRTTS